MRFSNPPPPPYIIEFAQNLTNYCIVLALWNDLVRRRCGFSDHNSMHSSECAGPPGAGGFHGASKIVVVLFASICTSQAPREPRCRASLIPQLRCLRLWSWSQIPERPLTSAAGRLSSGGPAGESHNDGPDIRWNPAGPGRHRGYPARTHMRVFSRRGFRYRGPDLLDGLVVRTTRTGQPDLVGLVLPQPSLAR